MVLDYFYFVQNLIELHVPDFDQALSFYSQLDFSVVREEPNYRVLKSGPNILNLYGGSMAVANHSYFGKFPANTVRGYGVEIVLFFDDIIKLHSRIKEKVEIISPPKLRDWGVRDFRLCDPFGFYLRISEPYDATTLQKAPLKLTDK